MHTKRGGVCLWREVCILGVGLPVIDVNLRKAAHEELQLVVVKPGDRLKGDHLVKSPDQSLPRDPRRCISEIALQCVPQRCILRFLVLRKGCVPSVAWRSSATRLCMIQFAMSSTYASLFSSVTSSSSPSFLSSTWFWLWSRTEKVSKMIPSMGLSRMYVREWYISLSTTLQTRTKQSTRGRRHGTPRQSVREWSTHLEVRKGVRPVQKHLVKRPGEVSIDELSIPDALG